MRTRKAPTDDRPTAPPPDEGGAARDSSPGDAADDASDYDRFPTPMAGTPRALLQREQERHKTPVAGSLEAARVKRAPESDRNLTPVAGSMEAVRARAASVPDSDRKETPVAGSLEAVRQKMNTLVPEFDMESFARETDKQLDPPDADPVDANAKEAYDAFLKGGTRPAAAPAAPALPTPAPPRKEDVFELSDVDDEWGEKPTKPRGPGTLEPAPGSSAEPKVETKADLIVGVPDAMGRIPVGELPPEDESAEILSLDAIIVAAIGPEEMRQLPLDPRIMFVLTQLDGSTDLGTVLEMTGVPPEEALENLEALARQGKLIRLA